MNKLFFINMNRGQPYSMYCRISCEDFRAENKKWFKVSADKDLKAISIPIPHGLFDILYYMAKDFRAENKKWLKLSIIFKSKLRLASNLCSPLSQTF